MEQSQNKKGRKSKRDSNRTETIIMRVTPEEKELIKRIHKDLYRWQTLTDFIITTIYKRGLRESGRIPIEELHKLDFFKPNKIN